MSKNKRIMTNYATKVKEIETLRPYTATVFVEIPQDKLHGLWKVSATRILNKSGICHRKRRICSACRRGG